MNLVEHSDHLSLLSQALDLDNLRLAWDEIADNEGIPGVDQVSIRAWRRNWDLAAAHGSWETEKTSRRSWRPRRRNLPIPAQRQPPRAGSPLAELPGDDPDR